MRLLTIRQSPTEQPQYFIRSVDGSNPPQQLTDLPNPNGTLGHVEKRLIQYQRADGVKLSGMLYLPPGFKLGTTPPPPMLMWAYPSEFKTRDAAGQVKDSPHRFVRVDARSPMFALLLGFSVLDNPTFPIVGEGKAEPNDTYVKQLVQGAEAAINEVVRLGAADRSRIAIGGHSYGAFTTANLLAHSDLFRAGIARSGAYNRTLTPFGFQSEERNFWQARDTYIEMMPFTFADKINEPLLMIHGADDDNAGTFPVQSERMFEALKGLGGTTRLVMLPLERHAYRARESLLHMLWEETEWLQHHVAQPTQHCGARTFLLPL
jgi:dipeptidyl aminopeptidase/acylaminoacyl peptidase